MCSSRSRYISLAAVLFFSMTVLAADPLAIRYHEEAESRFNSGDAKGALILLKNVLQRDPGQLSAKILLSRIYIELGEPRAAEEELLEALKLGADPRSVALPLARARNLLGEYDRNIEAIDPIRSPPALQAELLVELGLARLYSQDADGARSAFAQALDVNSQHVGARVGLARLPLHQKRFAEAGRLAEAIIRDAPENADAWFIKGSALHASGRLAQAVKAYGRAREIDPENLQAAIGQASALMDDASPAPAAAQLRGLREDHPNSPTVLYLLAKALRASDRADEANKALTDAASIVSQYSPVDIASQPSKLLIFGSIAFENGEFEQAFKFLSAYVDGGGEDIRGRKTLARTLVALDRPGDALRVLVRITANQQTDAETLMLLGDANIPLGDYEAAQRHYRDALVNYDAGPPAARRLAMAQYNSGQRGEGIATLQELVDLLPDDSGLDSSLLLGFVYLAENRLTEAEQIARRALNIAPDDKIVRNFLATTLLRQGQREQARSLYGELVAEDPDFRPARFNLIDLDIAQGDYAAATRELDDILTRDPNDAQALLNLARIARLRGDVRSAVQRLEKLHSTKPGWLRGATELVVAYLAEGRSAEALNIARKFEAGSPRNIEAHKLLATAERANGEPENARITLEKASLLASNDTRQLSEIGERQMQLGAYDKAAWSFTKVVELDPTAADARYNLAASLLRQSKVERAELEANELKRLHPGLAVADVLLADIRMAQGRLDPAIALYREVLERTGSSSIIDSLYRALVQNGREAEAAGLLRERLQEYPDEVVVLNLLAEHHLTRGESDAALPFYERLAELDQDNPQVLNNLAVALGGVDGERALKAALAAYQLSPENPFVLDTLGWSMIQLGELDKGLGYLREARVRHHSSPTIRYHLGVALHEFGNRQGALTELRSALRLGKDFPERADAEARVLRIEATTR